MKRTKYFLFAFCSFLLLFVSGCEEYRNVPLPVNETNSKAGNIENIRITNTPGGAIIQYDLSDMSNTQYVEAKYIRNGKEQKTISSIFSNELTIEGLPSTQEYNVELYVVDRAGNKSKTTAVQINPEPLYMAEVFPTIALSATFGGINISLTNLAEKGYVLYTLKETDSGWDLADWAATSAMNEFHTVRNLDDVPTLFGIYLVDEWGNHSDTLIETLTPLFEEEINKSAWKIIELASDVKNPGASLSNLFNDNFDDFGQSNASQSTLPSSFTVDLGNQYKFSRMKLWGRGPITTRAYLYSNPRLYNVYGSNTLSDDWSTWDLLLECESIKPSGLPYGQATAADYDFAAAGEENTFGELATSYRYLRFKIIDTWQGVNYFYFAEFTLWGQED